jgi:Flp pilus assembly protein TadD
VILDIFSRSRAHARWGKYGAVCLASLTLSIFFAAFSSSVSLGQVEAWAASGRVGETGVAENYADLKALYDRKRYQQVVEGGKKLLTRMNKGDVDYTRVTVLLSLAALKYQPPLIVAGLARDAYESGHGQETVPASNYGLLEIVVGDRELAEQLLQKVLQSAPDDFLSHLGLAELFAMDPKHDMASVTSEMARAEAADNTFGLSPGDKWLLIGDDYLILDDPAKALTAYLMAEKHSNPDLSARITQSIYRAALACGQLDLAKKRLDAALAAGAVSSEAYVLTAAKLCPPTDQGKALAKRVYDGAVAKTGDSDVMYKLGRAFGKGGQDHYALLCFKEALKLCPDDDKYMVAYAAQLAKSGDNVLARRQLAILAKRFKLQEPTLQHALTQGLALAGLNLLDDYNSDWASAVKQALGGKPRPVYKTAYAQLLNIKCTCRLLAMQQTLRTQPGVIFGYIPNDKLAVAALIYDSKIGHPELVWAKISKEAKIVPLAKEETLRDFSQLVQVALDYSEAQYHPLKPSFSFNPLPMRQME